MSDKIVITSGSLSESSNELTADLSPRHIDRLEKADKFPSRTQLGQRSVGWYEDDIIKWLDTRPHGPASTPLTDIQPNVVELDEIIKLTLQNIPEGAS